MTPERYREIEVLELPMTEQEISDGWHYCPDWDFLLIGPGMGELTYCTCGGIGCDHSNS